MSKFTNIFNGLTKVAGRSGLFVKKNSPTILLVLGITGGVVSTVMACKATLRVDEVLDEHKEKTDKIKECWEKVEKGDIPLDDYSLTDKKKDLTVAYTQTAFEFVKLYGPAVTLGIASIACVVSGHGIMMKRNVALVAAYKAVEEGFSAYRKRVIAEHGEDADYRYRHGATKMKVTDLAYTDEEGVEHGEVEREEYTVDTNDISMYAKFFDEGNPNWQKDASYNLMFLKAQQNYFNNILITRGHVFLNEVYDAIGIPRTKAGAVVGWVLGGKGNDYIDFGIFDNDNPRARAFVNGHERSILLDFNVDGLIYDLFTREKV